MIKTILSSLSLIVILSYIAPASALTNQNQIHSFNKCLGKTPTKAQMTECFDQLSRMTQSQRMNIRQIVLEEEVRRGKFGLQGNLPDHYLPKQLKYPGKKK